MLRGSQKNTWTIRSLNKYIETNHDEGCEYMPSCLNCTFPLCVKEDIIGEEKQREYLERYFALRGN